MGHAIVKGGGLAPALEHDSRQDALLHPVATLAGIGCGEAVPGWVLNGCRAAGRYS